MEILRYRIPVIDDQTRRRQFSRQINLTSIIQRHETGADLHLTPRVMRDGSARTTPAPGLFKTGRSFYGSEHRTKHGFLLNEHILGVLFLQYASVI